MDALELVANWRSSSNSSVSGTIGVTSEIRLVLTNLQIQGAFFDGQSLKPIFCWNSSKIISNNC